MESVIHPTSRPLLESMENNLSGHVAFVQRRVSGMLVDDREDLLVVDSGLSSDTFNKVLGARLDEAAADRRIDEALAHFRAVERPFSWWIGPCSRPLDLEERLRHRGMHASEYELGMAIELTELREPAVFPAGFATRRVRTPEELGDFARVLAGLSDPPERAITTFYERAAGVLLEDDCPMRLHVAYSEGEPAAVSELFLGGGVAGVHMVATSAKFRRLGLGLAMTRTAIADARGRGVETAVLQASEEGQGVYERLGFRACSRFVEYEAD